MQGDGMERKKETGLSLGKLIERLQQDAVHKAGREPVVGGVRQRFVTCHERVVRLVQVVGYIYMAVFQQHGELIAGLGAACLVGGFCFTV